MENTPGLYDTLNQMLNQPQQWLDVRHMETLAWMMVGLIETGLIGLNVWAPHVKSRAVQAQSTVRRFAHWLNNERIAVNELYGPLVQHALEEWGEYKLYLALDTTLLWENYCLVRIAVVFRGRAVPLVWQVFEHKSSTIAFERYKHLLDQANELLPGSCKVILLADRGFADTNLMAHASRLGWHWRIRFKGSFWLYRRGHQRIQPGFMGLKPGYAHFWQNVRLTK